jgi:hypothetical protein
MDVILDLTIISIKISFMQKKLPDPQSSSTHPTPHQLPGSCSPYARLSKPPANPMSR